MTVTVEVDLGERSYPIVIGAGALEASRPELSEVIGKGQAAIVADATVAELHLAALQDQLGGDVPVVTVPSGEASKSAAQYAAVMEALLAARVGRDGTVIALGGGVAGDLAGFCAATLRRGCQFVQVPTTLLSQVDSSVGGKTAINAAAGKNLIGTFYQPKLVIADTGLLSTLPVRELRAGYAEVVKYALLGDAAFFEWLEANGAATLALEPKALTYAIQRCCTMKAEIVADDETERGGRALLNLGHTFGHALEGVMGYDGRLLHGEGVAIGMAMAFRYAAQQGLCPPGESDRVTAHLAALGLGTHLFHVGGLQTSADALLDLMYQDKKAEGGALTLVLPHAIGEARTHKQVDPSTVLAFLTDELKTKPT